MAYVRKMRWCDELSREIPDKETITVFEGEHDTGLVDKDGIPLVWVAEPIGFIR